MLHFSFDLTGAGDLYAVGLPGRAGASRDRINKAAP